MLCTIQILEWLVIVLFFPFLPSLLFPIRWGRETGGWGASALYYPKLRIPEGLAMEEKIKTRHRLSTNTNLLGQVIICRISNPSDDTYSILTASEE